MTPSAPGRSPTRWPRWLRGIGPQVALLVLATTIVSLLIVAIGVLAVGRDTFARLMAEHGLSTTAANEMFDQSVSAVIVAALALAALAAIVLSVLVARRLAAPLRTIERAAERVAAGDYSARAATAGPTEVAGLATSFNQMAADLEAQEQMRRDFIANATHELRTPLTNLKGYLEALRDGVVQPDTAAFESLLEEVERLTRLARSLDTLTGTSEARLTGPGAPASLGAPGGRAGGAAPRRRDLVAAVQAAVELARPGLERAGVGLTIEAPPTLAAHFESDALAQVLGNLLQNAMRYTPAGGHVVIRVERGSAEHGGVDTARVLVNNTGDGIPAADLPHVFERFYRVDKSRARASGGAGIGLAIVQRLVEAGGGRVGVESEPGATSFWFTVPG